MQETRWKGEKARCISGGYKVWYCGSESKKNGVGIILKKEHVDSNHIEKGARGIVDSNRQDNMLEDRT